MSRVSRLQDALATLKRGMASLEPTHPFGTLTKAQKKEVFDNFRLWSSTWIEPAIEETIEHLKPKPKVPK